MKEVWKKINGYNNYEVSNHGRIRNKKKNIMNQFYKDRGDATIGLSKNGKRKTHRVARIVAQTFLEEDKKRTEVNHIDGNPRNNNVSNLEWVTPSENIRHAHKEGLIKTDKPVSLYCLDEKNSYFFTNQCAASKWLGRSKNFINERIKRNDLRYKNYIIVDDQ